MALDGTVVACITNELDEKLSGGKINKIYQPQKDEIVLNLRSGKENYKVLFCANAGQPRVHISDMSKENPISAPVFSMVLRKHISGGKISRVYQPSFERIVVFEIEAFDEMGDLSKKSLIIEIMGKHSNIILVDSNGKILDSVKRITHETSSVREVLPGKEYVYPPAQGKLNPLCLDKEEFLHAALGNDGLKAFEFIYKTYLGISPVTASEAAERAGISPSDYMGALDEKGKESLFAAFSEIMDLISKRQFSPEIILDPKNGNMIDFSSIKMTQFEDMKHIYFESISKLLDEYYAKKNISSYISSQTHDIKQVIKSNIERCARKKEIQKKTVADIKDMDTWKLWGSLITANIYLIKEGASVLKTINYYDEKAGEIEIPLDPGLSPNENAQRYFARYGKAKRTLEALKTQKRQNDEELEYLESLLVSLESVSEGSDIREIKNELKKEGYMKSKTSKKEATASKKAKPMHFISSDGFDIFVGKNNTQNDELTLKSASSEDIWLHTKDMPGSHVIIKNAGGRISETALFEAANLGAYFSKGRLSSNVPVDYTLKKYVKKPSEARPGMVVYTNNKTIYITPDEKIIESLKKPE